MNPSTVTEPNNSHNVPKFPSIFFSTILRTQKKTAPQSKLTTKGATFPTTSTDWPNRSQILRARRNWEGEEIYLCSEARNRAGVRMKEKLRRKHGEMSVELTDLKSKFGSGRQFHQRWEFYCVDGFWIFIFTN